MHVNCSHCNLWLAIVGIRKVTSKTAATDVFCKTYKFYRIFQVRLVLIDHQRRVIFEVCHFQTRILSKLNQRFLYEAIKLKSLSLMFITSVQHSLFNF